MPTEQAKNEKYTHTHELSISFTDKATPGPVVLRCFLNTTGISKEDAFSLLQSDPNITSYIARSELGIAYSIRSYHVGDNRSSVAEIGDILERQKPHNRPSILRPITDTIRDAVGESCVYFSDDAIDGIVNTELSLLGGKRPALGEVIAITYKCFRQVFDIAVKAIELDSDKLKPVNAALDGRHTFARGLSEHATENHPLVPTIASAIIAEVRHMTEYRYSSKELVQLILNHDFESLNGVISNLNIGVNGSLRNHEVILERLNINVQNNKLSISLNSDVQQEKIREAHRVNKFRTAIRSSLVELAELVKQKGFLLTFAEDHFSFDYGTTGKCPVSGATPYTEQVKLLYRILAVTEKYL